MPSSNIHPTFSSTQIPTLNSNHTHPHPHLHPPSHLLRPRADSPKRSISYTTTPTHVATPVATPVATTSTTAGTGTGTALPRQEKHDDLTCDHKVKGALTELLNDGCVKADVRGRRSVQRLLMETERELRMQRRESLGRRGRRRGEVALEIEGASSEGSESVSGESISKRDGDGDGEEQGKG
ncbi:hypothetical protein P170DRAFT_58709 [Aspergillus steynii IBT 23096]|uniref:Uncharacterized protein n=1 Tax=Aspergillus steynii IBT 23096 TaxID=1392250 RepID=A0A2I2FSL7_9EURO|nr:uncharacterized protein P170DRAFT_58709 [Aspergillus steynii IBT 23096]PLB43638.1 hypothetical protein P170DRAFT_58709 [Aspergillus steynii IBT 23096]